MLAFAARSDDADDDGGGGGGGAGSSARRRTTTKRRRGNRRTRRLRLLWARLQREVQTDYEIIQVVCALRTKSCERPTVWDGDLGGGGTLPRVSADRRRA